MPRINPDFTYINPCIKYTLFFLNLLFWVIGGIIFGIGIWSFLEEYKYKGALPDINNVFDFIFQISIVLMTLGAIVFIICFTGCLGALRENCCLLRFYSACLLILFLGEVALGILVFVFPNKLTNLVKKGMSKELIEKYRDDSNLQNFIDTLQKQFECCGISDNSYKDWSWNIYFNCTDSNPSPQRCAVPYSCCKNPYNLETNLVNYMCGYNMQKEHAVSKLENFIFTRGCIQAIQNFVYRNSYVIGGIILIISLLQLFATYLCRTLLAQIEAQKSLWS